MGKASWGLLPVLPVLDAAAVEATEHLGDAAIAALVAVALFPPGSGRRRDMTTIAILVAVAAGVVLIWLAIRDKRTGDDESVLLGKWRRHRDGTPDD